MTIDKLTKQSFDSFILTANFEDNMRVGDTIVLSTSTVTVKDKDGEDVTSVILEESSKAASGMKLQIRVRAGTESLSPFIVTFKAITTMEDKWEKDVKVKIKEIN